MTKTKTQYSHFEECLFANKDLKTKLAIPIFWEDISYGNDVCPSFAYKGYQIWIDHPDYEQRENGLDIKRFCVTREKDYGEINGPLLETDNFDMVKKLIEMLNKQPRE